MLILIIFTINSLHNLWWCHWVYLLTRLPSPGGLNQLSSPISNVFTLTHRLTHSHNNSYETYSSIGISLMSCAADLPLDVYVNWCLLTLRGFSKMVGVNFSFFAILVSTATIPFCHVWLKKQSDIKYLFAHSLRRK